MEPPFSLDMALLVSLRNNFQQIRQAKEAKDQPRSDYYLGHTLTLLQSPQNRAAFLNLISQRDDFRTEVAMVLLEAPRLNRALVLYQESARTEIVQALELDGDNLAFLEDRAGDSTHDDDIRIAVGLAQETSGMDGADRRLPPIQ